MAEQKALALIDGKISEIPLGDTIRGAGSSGGGFQKYLVQTSESYVIPIYISSVVTGSFINDGSTEILGKLEVI